MIISYLKAIFLRDDFRKNSFGAIFTEKCTRENMFSHKSLSFYLTGILSIVFKNIMASCIPEHLLVGIRCSA